MQIFLLLIIPIRDVPIRDVSLDVYFFVVFTVLVFNALWQTSYRNDWCVILAPV
jgi:hypothetical protein